MRSLFYEGPGSLAWRELPEPIITAPTDALVEPIAVALCDIDTLIVRGLTPFPPPFALGHECVAKVVSVGSEVRDFSEGDIVVVPFQIACGACRPCRSGRTAHCATVPEYTAGYGFGAAGGDYGGVLSDLVRVPFADAMLVRAPAGVDVLALASCSDNVADGWRTVAPYLADVPGASVLVVGGMAPSVGLYAVAAAIESEAARVDYIDRDPVRLEIAASLGANPIDGLPPRAKPIYEVTVDASGDPRSLHHAALSTAADGHLFIASIYFNDEVPLPMKTFYMRGARLTTGRLHSRTLLPQILDLVERGSLHPEHVTTEVAAWDDAPAAILRGTSGKLIIRRT